MNAIINDKAFKQLKPSEQNRIIELCKQAAHDAIDAEQEYLQILMIKMCAIVMHRSGATTEQIMQYFGNWRMTYSLYHRNFKKGTEKEWLQKQLDEAVPGIDINKYLEAMK